MRVRGICPGERPRRMGPFCRREPRKTFDLRNGAVFTRVSVRFSISTGESWERRDPETMDDNQFSAF